MPVLQFVFARIDEPHVDRSGGKIIVIDRGNGSLAGLVEVERQNSWAWIHTIYVAEPHRRKGLGLEMLSLAGVHAFSWFPDAHGIAAGVKAENAPSRALFEKAGFSYSLEWDGGVLLYSKARPTTPRVGGSS